MKKAEFQNISNQRWGKNLRYLYQYVSIRLLYNASIIVFWVFFLRNAHLKQELEDTTVTKEQQTQYRKKLCVENRGNV